MDGRLETRGGVVVGGEVGARLADLSRSHTADLSAALSLTDAAATSADLTIGERKMSKSEMRMQ